MSTSLTHGVSGLHSACSPVSGYSPYGLGWPHSAAPSDHPCPPGQRLHQPVVRARLAVILQPCLHQGQHGVSGAGACSPQERRPAVPGEVETRRDSYLSTTLEETPGWISSFLRRWEKLYFGPSGTWGWWWPSWLRRGSTQAPGRRFGPHSESGRLLHNGMLHQPLDLTQSASHPMHY